MMATRQETVKAVCGHCGGSRYDPECEGADCLACHGLGMVSAPFNPSRHVTLQRLRPLVAQLEAWRGQAQQEASRQHDPARARFAEGQANAFAAAAEAVRQILDPRPVAQVAA